MNETQLRDRFTSPLSKPEEKWRVAVAGDGRIVGSAAVWHPEPDAERVFVFVIAYPREPSTYEQLLDWGEGRPAA